MEYIIGILFAAIGGVFYFKSKADKAAVDAKLAHIKGRDKELKEQQEELGKVMDFLDEQIKQAKTSSEVKKKIRKHMTLKERRELSNKRFGKKNEDSN
jgi:hypothetical protein